MYVKQLKDMNLLDDFLFGAFMSVEEYAEILGRNILETLFRRKVGKLKIHTQKVIFGSSSKQHGIRMDAYIEESGDEVSGEGAFYDIEPDRKERNKKSLPQRTRYYHLMANSDILKAGKGYPELRKVYVIMILPFDPFDKDRMVYTVKNMCVEEPGIPYEDGARTIYLYVNGKQGNPPKELADLLKYIADTNRANAVSANLREIQDKVELIKADKEVQREAMKFEELIKFEREEAAEEAVKEAEKKAAEEAQRADKEAERADQEAERADQEAERADKEAERADKEAERADKEAEKAVKEAEKAVKEAEKAVKEAEKAVKESKRADAAEALLAKYRERFGLLSA